MAGQEHDVHVTEPQGEWTVLSMKPENERVASIVLQHVAGAPLERWVPGQYVKISVLLGGAWSDVHPFTLSNAPGSGHLRLTVKSLGPFTTAIHGVPPGTPVRVSGPSGTFCRDLEESDRAILVAGGIGITPFLSVLQGLREHRSPTNVILFWANNMAADLFGLDELAQAASELDLKTVLLVLDGSAPTPARAWAEVEAGTLSAPVLGRHAAFGDGRVYLCGSRGMQTYVTEQLRALGVPPEQVSMETFGAYAVDTGSKPPSPQAPNAE